MCLLLAFSIAPNNLKTTILGEDMQVAKISSVVGVLFVFVSIKKKQQQQLNNLKFPPLLVFCFVLDVFVKKKKRKKKLQGSSIIAEFLARVRSPIAK